MTKKILSVLLVLAMIFSLVACGGEKESEEEVVEEVKDYEVAVSLPFTGSFASYANYLKKGMELAIKHLEEDGGLNGKGGTIHLTYYDDACDPQEGVSIAEEIVEDEKYLVQVGSFSSAVTLPCATVYNENEMVQLAPTCSHQDFLSMTDWGFSLAMSQDTIGGYLAGWATNYLNAKNIAVLYGNDEIGIAASTSFMNTAKKLGANIVAEEDFEEGATNDFTSIMTKLKSQDIDLIFTVCSEDEQIYMVKQANQLGLSKDIKWMTCVKAATQNVVDALGELAEGIYSYYSMTGDESNSVYVRYRDDYLAENPDEKTTSQWADYGYNAIRMVIWTIENGGTDRSSFRDVLATMQGFQGVDGTISYGEGHKLLREQQLIVCKDGVWTPVDPGFDVTQLLLTLN